MLGIRADGSLGMGLRSEALSLTYAPLSGLWGIRAAHHMSLLSTVHLPLEILLLGPAADLTSCRRPHKSRRHRLRHRRNPRQRRLPRVSSKALDPTLQSMLRFSRFIRTGLLEDKDWESVPLGPYHQFVLMLIERRLKLDSRARFQWAGLG